MRGRARVGAVLGASGHIISAWGRSAAGDGAKCKMALYRNDRFL